VVERETTPASAKRGCERKAAAGKRRENGKKMLNRGNKPKDLLKTNGLGVFRAKNKLVFWCKNPQTKRKKGLKMPNFEAGIRKLATQI
jgi:hypothetical protein